MSLKQCILLFILLILPCSAQQSTIKNYTTLDGLPVSRIFDSAQEENGNMWFAAERGLIEYNGATWTYYDSLQGNSLNQNFAFIKLDDNGTLWAIPEHSGEKIWFRHAEDWDYIRPLNKYDGIIISCDVKVSSGKTTLLLITRESKIFLVTKDSTVEVETKTFNTGQIYAGIFVNEKILFASHQGLIFYDPSSGIANNDNQTRNKIIYAIDRDSTTGEIFFLSESQIGFVSNKKTRTIDFGFKIQFYDRHINHAFIKCSPDSNIYFGTQFRTHRYNRTTSQTHELTTNNGYTTSGATSAFVDYEKNVWLTSLRGINKVRYSPFININSNNNLLENEVTSIEKFPNGAIALGHNIGLSFRINDQALKLPFEGKEAGVFSRILDMAYDKYNDVIWFTAQRLGLGYITRDLKIHWKISKLNGNQASYTSIFPRGKDEQYFSTNLGFYKLIDNSQKVLLANKHFNIRRMLKYNSDTLICATNKGILFFNENNYSYKLINHSSPLKSDIYDLQKLDKENWLVGSSAGLLIFDRKTIKEFNELPINKPVFFIKSENDYIWFGLMGGVIRWNRTTGKSNLFTTFDGLSGVETNRDAFLFDDDKVYIGTDKGLSIFSSKSFKENTHSVKPKISFDCILDSKGNKYDIDSSPTLRFNNNNIILKYNSASFIDESSNKYFIIVNNIDKETTEKFTTSKNEFVLPNLSPGIYSIGLFAKNPAGVSSDTLYSANITINAPFYLENWFYALIAFLLISITYSLYDYLMKNRYSKQLELKVNERTAQLQKSENNIRELTQRIFTAQEIEREKIARDLHDNIAQDMAMIKLEIENITRGLNKYEKENKKWLIEKVEELTKYLRDMSYFLHPNSIKQIGFMNAVQSLCNEFVAQTKIEIDFFSNLNEGINLGEEVSTNIYRFIQEGLTNIRKHSKATNGIVIIVLRDDSLVIRVEDDGIGFDIDKVSQSKAKRNMGLKSMEERILFVGGNLSIKSSKDEGTKLNAKIPLSAIYNFSSSANIDQASGS